MTEFKQRVVLDAGGTISSRHTGGALAPGQGGDLALRLGGDAGLRVRTVHVGLSADMALDDALAIARAALDEAATPGVAGVVVAHGTDALEETAFLTSLFYGGGAPIVFTGAQRAPGAADFDGDRNLADALAVAGAVASGVMVVFAGQVLDARVDKRSTVELEAFTGRGAAMGRVQDGRVFMSSLPQQRPALPMPSVLEPTVEVIPVSLGDQGLALDRAAAAGVRGLVLQAMGRGNASMAVAAAAARAQASGVVMALVSRSSHGPVAPDYVTGRRMADAGAVFCGDLSAPQARLLLTVLLALHADPEVAREALIAWLAA